MVRCASQIYRMLPMCHDDDDDVTSDDDEKRRWDTVRGRGWFWCDAASSVLCKEHARCPVAMRECNEKKKPPLNTRRTKRLYLFTNSIYICIALRIARVNEKKWRLKINTDITKSKYIIYYESVVVVVVKNRRIFDGYSTGKEHRKCTTRADINVYKKTFRSK